jgi:dihydroneopterin aldolase
LTRDIVVGEPCLLIEAVAQRIADRVLTGYASVDRVVVRIRKPEVPIAGSVLGSSEVSIERDRRDLVTEQAI